MIYTMSTQKGVILRSGPDGYFKLEDPGIVACGRCGGAVLTLLRTRHREVCKLEETGEALAPPKPDTESIPQDPRSVPNADKVIDAAYPPEAPPQPPRHPLIVIPQLAKLPKPPGGKK